MEEQMSFILPWTSITQQWTESNRVQLRSINNCFVSMWIHSSSAVPLNNTSVFGISNGPFRLLPDQQNEPTEVCISIRKNVLDEMTADLTIQTDHLSTSTFDSQGVFQRKSFAWTEACDFTNIKLKCRSELSVKCTIKCYPYGPIPTYNNEFQRFLLQSSFSDVKIIISGEELPAHRVILAAYSPVFLSMLESNMKEGKDNQVVIEDITVDVMRNVLTVLYTGCHKVLDDLDMAMNMLVVTEKYDMEKVKNLCEYKLLEHLTISNALEIVDLAYKHNAEKLKGECWKFIMKYKKEIANSPHLETFCLINPGLMCAFTKDALNE